MRWTRSPAAAAPTRLPESACVSDYGTGRLGLSGAMAEAQRERHHRFLPAAAIQRTFVQLSSTSRASRLMEGKPSSPPVRPRMHRESRRRRLNVAFDVVPPPPGLPRTPLSLVQEAHA